jgi:hypothetical protein
MSSISTNGQQVPPLPAGAVSADDEWWLDKHNRTVRWFYGRYIGNTVTVRQWGVQEIGGAVVARYLEVDTKAIDLDRLDLATARALARNLNTGAAEAADAEAADGAGL